MKHIDRWKPSKFVFSGGRLRASRDNERVGIGSRLICDIIAGMYGEFLPLHAKGQLADLGCGRIPLYEAYRDHIDNCVCVDWGNTMHPNEHLDIECDLSKSLPLPDAGFDTIILSDVLEHIAQPERLWAEMARILKPHGKVLMNVPFFYWLHEEPHDYYRYTEHALRRFAELAGFQIVLLRAVGGSPEIVTDILAKHLQYIPLIGRFSAMAIQSVTATFLKLSIGKRISQRTSRMFPLGYFLIAEKAGP